MVDADLEQLVSRYGVRNLLTRGVLIVDDEPDNIAVLRAFLEDDYDVHEATSGAMALAIAEHTPLDVVITDQRMPEMTGVELLERLRERRPDVTGLLLTGYTDTAALVSAINRAHAFRYLKKPWEPQDVLDAVAQAQQIVYQRRAISQLVGLLSHRTDELSAALTDLRATQQQMLHLERVGTLGRLTAGVAHDLSNAIQGLVYLEHELQERSVEDDVFDVVRVGLSGARNLLDTLLTMNQYVNRGNNRPRLAQISPSAVIRDAITVMRLDMSFRARNVVVKVPPNIADVVADQQKLVQVMVNLIRNAIQATSEQQTIVIELSGSPKGEVVFAVEDDGPGVPAHLRARLFDPFVSTKGEMGMGIGLYMVRLVVESHRGQVVCADGPLGGARFEIRLPSACPQEVHVAGGLSSTASPAVR